MKPDELADYVENFRRRVLQDALSSASAEQWRRRAERFDAAIPRRDDYMGRATPAEIEAQRMRLAEVTLACRRHAELMLGGRL